jgi:hypothetical protein
MFVGKEKHVVLSGISLRISNGDTTMARVRLGARPKKEE